MPLNKFAKKYPIYFLAGILVLTAIMLVARNTSLKARDTVPADNRQEILPAKATKDINREFEFPIEKVTSGEPRKIKFLIQNAELRDEIVIKGQKATSIKGRTFLILNVKLTNNLDKGIEINTKDFVRVATKGSEEWLAPDIHNDPVVIQAISTKVTRLGVPINDTDKELVLQIGPIDGAKEKIDLAF